MERQSNWQGLVISLRKNVRDILVAGVVVVCVLVGMRTEELRLWDSSPWLLQHGCL